MLAFWSSQLAQEVSNFLGGPVQTAEGATVLGGGYALYLKHKCGHCWRIGRHTVTVHTTETAAWNSRKQGGKAHSTTYPSCRRDLDKDHAAKARECV